MKDSYNNLIKLTNLLSDGEFHDGDTLGKRIGVSRTAIWKMIKKLIDYGVVITSVKGKGYSLEQPLALLDPKSIDKKLEAKIAKKLALTVLESVPSTNLYLRRHEASRKALVCIAEHQSAGIGRLGRVWSSPFGLNLYLSCRYTLRCDIADLSGFSLAISIAILQTLKKLGLKPQVKWPNDVYCADKKIAGNVIELLAESNGGCTAIIGVGINVNMLKNTDKIPKGWTSMCKEADTDFDRNIVAAELIKQLDVAINTFVEKGLSYFKDIYAQHDYLFQRTITLQQYQSTLEGTAVGIDDSGRLLLEVSPGCVTPISVGDATIKA